MNDTVERNIEVKNIKEEVPTEAEDIFIAAERARDRVKEDKKDVATAKKEEIKEAKAPQEVREEVKEDSEESGGNEFKKLYEKLKEESETNAKFSREKGIKLKKIANSLKKTIDAGLLDEEEGQNILSLFDKDDIEESENNVFSNINPSLKPIYEKSNVLSDKVVKDYLDFVDFTQEEYEKKIKGFTHFLQESDQNERDELEEEIAELQGSPLKLLKFIVKKGEDFLNDSSFGDFLSSGGFKEMRKQQESREKALKQKIQKLEKELESYKGEGTGKFKIKESAPSSRKISDSSDVFLRYEERSF